jgi:hypothetical protein
MGRAPAARLPFSSSRTMIRDPGKKRKWISRPRTFDSRQWSTCGAAPLFVIPDNDPGSREEEED